MTVIKRRYSDGSWRVLGVTDGGSGASVPLSPTNVQVNSNASGQATVSWNSPSDTGGTALTGYTIHVNRISTSTSSTTTVNESTTTTTISSLEPTEVYEFTVQAVNSVGSSSESSPAVQVVIVGGDGSTIPTTMESSISQNDITINFDTEYPVGYYVTGDPFVVGSPVVTSITPGWDGSRHGATLNPPIDQSGYHTALNYSEELNFAANLPQQIPVNNSLIATSGWLASDPEVQSLGITITSKPAAPRPCIRDSLVLTSVPQTPAVGSFRPPYVAGPKWQYNVSQIDWSVLANLTPSANAPSWPSVEQSLAKSWAPDAGYGSTASRYFHPYNHMPDYGRDLCARMYSAILRLNTNATQAEKTYTLHKVIQFGIDTLAITNQAAIANYVRSGAQTSPGWWADFGGGHGVGRDMPALLTKVVLQNPTELQSVWDLGCFWWGDAGQIWVSNGNSSQDPWRSAGEATWGESPHTRPSSRRPGTTSYRTCCTAQAQNAGVLAAHAMGIADQWNFSDAPFIDYMDWYMDVDQVSAGNSSPRVIRTWFGEMWDAHRDSL